MKSGGALYLIKLRSIEYQIKAGTRTWRNRKIKDEDAKWIEKAARKLRKDTIITLRYHKYIVDWVCNLDHDYLDLIEDESVFIDNEGNL